MDNNTVRYSLIVVLLIALAFSFSKEEKAPRQERRLNSQGYDSCEDDDDDADLVDEEEVQRKLQAYQKKGTRNIEI